MPSSDRELGERLVRFLDVGPFGRQITKNAAMKPAPQRIKLSGGARMSQLGEGETMREALEQALERWEQSSG